MDNGIRVIAFYLPQFHPTLNNDKWWGKGFTEWTNVGKATPLFRGHYQPKVPADLGYYDLRLPEARLQPAELASEAGIAGFCYYHYWFESGKEELDLPFKQVVNTGQPDFPFCLCWANESWHCKFWNKDGTATKKLLIEQKYLGKEDNEKHFYSLIHAFKDKRYMRYDDKLIFMIYRALDFENVTEFIHQWNELAQKNGLAGFHFISQCNDIKDIPKILNLGFNAVNLLRLNNFDLVESSKIQRFIQTCYHKLFKRPYVYQYKNVIDKLTGIEEAEDYVYPSIVPNWDHTPRSGYGGYLLDNSTPDLFDLHLKKVINAIRNKSDNDKIVFLKSWNEWGEGNYVEPDLVFGHGYLNVLAQNLLISDK